MLNKTKHDGYDAYESGNNAFLFVQPAPGGDALEVEFSYVPTHDEDLNVPELGYARLLVDLAVELKAKERS